MASPGTPGRKGSKPNVLVVDGHVVEAGPSPKKPSNRRSETELSDSLNASMQKLQALIVASAGTPAGIAADAAAAAAASAARAAAAVDISAGSAAAAGGNPLSGLASEVGLAPLLIAAGGEAPFEKSGAKEEAEAAAKKDGEGEGSSSEEDGVEPDPILDREALKQQARRIVQKKIKSGKGRGGAKR